MYIGYAWFGFTYAQMHVERSGFITNPFYFYRGKKVNKIKYKSSETEFLFYVNPGAMESEIKLEKAIKRVIMP